MWQRNASGSRGRKGSERPFGKAPSAAAVISGPVGRRQPGRIQVSSGREYSEGRLKELVLYLACASETADPGFGMVKLNKLLYRADFEAFRRLGHSLTGETYQKQAYGPV